MTKIILTNTTTTITGYKLKFVCRNCPPGEEMASFDINRHDWYPYIINDNEIGASPSDHEETRYYLGKLQRTNMPELRRQMAEARRIISTSKVFNCSRCGEEACVDLITED